MIGQNLHYLNNKKYITNTANMDSVMFEFSSFYHTKAPRLIGIVNGSEGAPVVISQYEEIMSRYTKNYADFTRFFDYDVVNDIDFIQGSDKCILIMDNERDQLSMHVRYIAGLLHACGWYGDSADDTIAMAKHFVKSVMAVDNMMTIMANSAFLGTTYINDTLEEIFTNEEPYVVTFENGKNFSYDLLFFLNDHYTCSEVQELLIEKFTIQSTVMVQDVMEHFTSRRHYLAYFDSVLDWMVANDVDIDTGSTTKQQFLNQTFGDLGQPGAYTAAFYRLHALWKRVSALPAFIAAHDAKASEPDGWEYKDIYTEIDNVFPLVKMVLERTWDLDNLTRDLKMINTDVQFFSKRQNRIPYLIHKYPLI